MDSNWPESGAFPGDHSRREMDLYPDLVRMGGLSAAMIVIGSEHGIDLGEVSSQPVRARIKPAEVQSVYGAISVLAGKSERSFSVGISHRGFLLAGGVTEALLDVVRLAGVWRTGISLSSLEEQFPFMHVEPLAKAFEDGNGVAFRWDELLRDPDLDDLRPLLIAVRSDRVLGRLFPSVSHLTLLRLELNLDDAAVSAILIDDAEGLDFTVDATWIEGSASRVASINEALEVAALLLQKHCEDEA